MFSSIQSVLLLAFGFGFVIFFHELGHFLAAKWAGVKVEQFAVGFGHAMLAWRKGLGLRQGSTQDEFRERINNHIEHKTGVPVIEASDQQVKAAADELGISETEYRLNWIPLGGYVKMLGQDDMRPGVTADDPRAFNNKTIGQRMVIVSAGVVMNVLLAAFGFMIIFLAGFKVPPAIVGSVVPGAPAQQTYRLDNGKQVKVPLVPGDRILYLNDRYQSDFEKIRLNTALLQGSDPIPLYVQHRDGSKDHLFIQPIKSDGSDFLLLGISQAYELRGFDEKDKKAKSADLQILNDPQLTSAQSRLVLPGDLITAIDGQSVNPKEFWRLDDAMQHAAGKAVTITIKSSNGQTHTAQLQPRFSDRFGTDSVNFLGLLMRPRVQSLMPESPAKGKIQPGDVITSFSDAAPGGDRCPTPTREELMKWLNAAGQKGGALDITVLRDEKEVQLKNVSPSLRLSPGRYGVGIGLAMDELHPVVAGTVEGSPARAAGVPAGARIVSINQHPVQNWFDVNNAIASLSPDQPVSMVAQVNGKETTYALGKVTEPQIADVKQNRLIAEAMMLLEPASDIRKTSSPWVAAGWGVGETRDACLQVYQTVRAMFTQSISVRQVSGPVGILAVGYKFAEMGIIRLTWFLSIISANLAVMNFLPIPIVDGGLFTFLIIEKIKGGPISPKVQSIAQVVGLAILLSVFLFATYQDVFYRLPFLNH